MVKLGAIRDNRPDAPKNDGRYIEWIYDRTDNGVVDAWLVDQLIAAQRKYDNDYRAYKKQQKGESTTEQLPAKIVEKKPIKNSITEWVANELNKDTLLEGGYLKADQKQIYELILSTFSNLEQLKEVVSKLKW